MKSTRNAFGTSPGTLVLVGDSPDSTILAGLLESRRWKGVHWRYGGQNYTTLQRVQNISEAIEFARASQGVAIVVADPSSIEQPITDARGNQVELFSELFIIEQLLGRVPLDLVRNEEWVGDVRQRVAQGTYAKSKRAFDLGIAIFGGLLLLPLIGFTALIVFLTRGRPVIIDVPSYGQDNSIFNLKLFRTDDSRIEGDVTLGRPWANELRRLVRHNHLHVLPSLWNLLIGDISVVGPRPEPVGTIDQRSGELFHLHLRHLMRPGLVSLAQVRFRYSEAPRDTRLALEYDLYYVRHARLTIDLKVMLRGMWLAFTDALAFLASDLRLTARLARRGLSGLSAAIPRGQQSLGSVAFPKQFSSTGAPLKATLIVGSGSGGNLIAKEMRGNPHWGYWPVGFVDDDQTKIGTRICGLPVVGTTGAIPAYVRREHIDAVVIAIPSAPEIVVNRIAELARQSTAQVLKMPHIGEALYNQTGAVRLQAVRVTDVLGRDIVAVDQDRCREFIRGRRVLITGAAGSIGREVVRQVAQLQPDLLVGLDINESDLFDLQQELKAIDSPISFAPVIASITNSKRLGAIFESYQPEIIFHAAAYKHVPLMEEYPQEAIWSNTIGTYETARAAVSAGVKRFILVSSDKAVRPSSVMGATKRLAEIVLRGVSQETGLCAGAVRFGNVLGSRGSVIPTFEKQIAAGGPITITDPRMKRYFMTIPEAAGLIVQAGAFGDRNVIYMLDMGEEVAIKDLAERMIRLHGLRVGTDIEIVYTGLRPGEKIREELSHDFETAGVTAHPKIRVLDEATTGPAANRTMHSRDIVTRLIRISELSCAEEIRAEVIGLVGEIDGGIFNEYPESLWLPTNEMHHAVGKVG